MPRKLIKRYMPDPHKVREHRHLRLFGRLLHDPNLWHLNRRSVVGAVSVGLFMAWVPVPFQMLLAAAAAIPLRVNLPIAVGLVWITNPLTMPPLFYFAYKVGAWMLGDPIQHVDFELSASWLSDELAVIWRPFLTGCFVMGVLSAGAGNMAVRLLWRLHILRYLRQRRERRAEARQEDPAS